MKYKWLNRKTNNQIVLFFNGWGMDENVVNHLDAEDYDILMFFDYNTLETDFDFALLDKYSKKILVAWSMGVMIGSIYSKQLTALSQSIAINGTPKPIHERFGIHPKIYDLTINGFNEIGRNKFINSMFDTKPSPLIFHSDRTIEGQLSELIALKKYNSNENFKFNKVLISDNDKIIPTKSQIAYWGIKPNIRGGHCLFFQFSKWSELL